MASQPIYTVELDNFYGPLDLLLSLIERKELVVTDVAVGQVTNDYLATITALEKVGDQELSWFLDVATRLIFYKAQALGQRYEIEEGGLEDLTRELERYRSYRELARGLAQRLRSALTTRPVIHSSHDNPPANLTVNNLRSAYRSAHHSTRHQAIPLQHRVLIRRSDISRTMELLLKRSGVRLMLRDVFRDSDRRSLALTLLALLELARQTRIQLWQEEGRVYVQAT